MALDLGTLTMGVQVDTARARRDLTVFDRDVDQLGRRRRDPVRLAVDPTTGERVLSKFTRRLDAVPDTVETAARVDTSAGDRALTRWQRAVQDATGTAVARVDADTSPAMAAVDRLRRAARSIPARVDVSGAEDAFRGLAKAGADAGKKAGADAGSAIMDGIRGIPVAGLVAGLGVAAGAAFWEGFEREASRVDLEVAAGLDPAESARIARAAGEAYADNWGDSLSANLETARAALQSGLLPEIVSERETQRTISRLTLVSDVLREDVGRTTRAVATILRNDLAGSSEEAFDLLLTGAQRGANEAEDLLDTFTEYPALFRRLGLSGAESMGLIQQGLQAGARDADFVADAIKEFQIRATDGSTAAADGYKALGLSAEKTTAQIAAGGESAREGLDTVLDRLRAVEDPVARNAAAVALFGTKAEDLGDALFALDVDAAAEGMSNFAGASQRASDALGSTTQAKVQTAWRNIQTAIGAASEALAVIAGPGIQELADNVTENREAVVGFLFDIINGALDGAEALVQVGAAGVEGFGTAAAGAAGMVDAIASATEAAADFAYAMGRRGLSADLRDAADGMRGAADDMRALEPASQEAAEGMRRRLIDEGIDPVRERLGDVQITAEAQARWHDATTRMQGDLGDLGTAADGTALDLMTVDGALQENTRSGRVLVGQVRDVIAGMEDQARAGIAAGRSVEDLTADYRANRAALVDSLMTMGLSRKEAEKLADRYDDVPRILSTQIKTPGLPKAIERVERLARAAENADGTRTLYFRSVIQGSLPGRGFTAAALNSGGRVGVGRGVRDTVPAVLTEGEWVIRAPAVQALEAAHGRGIMERINAAGPGSADRVLDGTTRPAAAALRAVPAPTAPTATGAARARDITVHVHNPAPEPASVSVGRALRAHLADVA